jgi:hypothetical protein
MALGQLFDIDLNGVGQAKSFRADLASYFMGPMVLGTAECTAQNYGRTGRTIARSGIDPFLVQLYTKGGFTGTADHKDMTVKAGDVCVFDMARNLDTHSPRSSNITLIVPRALLAPLVKDADALHGTVLNSGSAYGGVIADYIRSLHARVERMTLAQANALTGCTVALLAACLGPSAESGDERRNAFAPALLFDIRRHIETNLASPDLTVEGVPSIYPFRTY